MNPYHPAADCAKCGFHDVATRYDSGEIYGIHREQEHLERRCRRCLYSWKEQVIPPEQVSVDAEIAAADVEDSDVEATPPIDWDACQSALESAYVFLLSQRPEFRIGCQPQLLQLLEVLYSFQTEGYESICDVQSFYEAKGLQLRILGDAEIAITPETLRAAGYLENVPREICTEHFSMGNIIWGKPKTARES